MSGCLVIDPLPMVRVGVLEVLGERFEVDHVASREAAIDMVRDLGGFELAIINTCTPANGGEAAPTGPEAIRAIKRNSPATAIVAHGQAPVRHLASAAFRAGASAFVSRHAPPETLVEAIEAVLDDRRFEDPLLPPPRSRTKLTGRQRQIMQLLADGESTAIAAKQLGLSEETVKTHTRNILARLGARNRAHAVAIALRESLVD